MPISIEAVKATLPRMPAEMRPETALATALSIALDSPSTQQAGEEDCETAGYMLGLLRDLGYTVAPLPPPH